MAEESEFDRRPAPHRLPALLLDVDGVLVPFGPALGRTMVDAGVNGEAPYVRYDARLPEWLKTLRSAYDLVWATNWEEEANQVLCPQLELPPLPVIRFAGGSSALAGETLKLSAIKGFVGDRPFAWVDDDIGPDAHRWAANRGAPTLLVEVRANRGIGLDEIEELTEFAQGLSSLEEASKR